jgi:hypothetical protein
MYHHLLLLPRLFFLTPLTLLSPPFFLQTARPLPHPSFLDLLTGGRIEDDSNSKEDEIDVCDL